MRLAVFVLFALAACSEFETPAELSRPQVLGLRVTPKTLTPGQRGRLTALVAGPQGPIEVEPEWSTQAQAARVEHDADGSWLAIDESAPLAAVEIAARFEVDETLLAVRTVEVSLASRDNPVIAAIRADGAIVTAQGARADLGELLPLAAEVPPDSEVAWYATLGEIEIYHRAVTELEATEAGAGWLIAVCRDPEGGIDWATAPLRIE